VAEVCDGASVNCPADAKAPDGTPCGLSCSTGDQCTHGFCSASNPGGGCGDGIVACGEECDDGNTKNGDGCSGTCKIESTGEICGDLIDNDINGLYDCDDPNCSCPAMVNGGLPPRMSRLIVGRRNLDVIRLKGAVLPTAPVDLSKNKFGVLITNASGLVYSVEIPAGQIEARGKRGTWVYRNRGARSGGGIQSLRVKTATAGGGSVLNFSLVAMGKLNNATDPVMTTEIVVGDQYSGNTMNWEQLRTGFKGEFP
jgi:cysteine-rich repeat protein